ncbi:MAG: glutaredoxin family protein [Solirubrobacterales bacterium]
MTEVVLVTREDCEFCEQAKSVLGRLQPELGLHVREVALESDEGKSLAAGSGALFPPVLVVEGQALFYGRLSEKRLRKALSG